MYKTQKLTQFLVIAGISFKYVLNGRKVVRSLNSELRWSERGPGG